MINLQLQEFVWESSEITEKPIQKINLMQYWKKLKTRKLQALMNH